MGKYQIIYADPPWSYRSGKVKGAAQNHYPTMSDEQLYQLPVSKLAADTSVLFLWCTFPKLPEALKLIKAWVRQMNALKLEMKKAVHQENFERAAELRDQIRSLEAAHKEQKENK